jgi:hypothetical protein
VPLLVGCENGYGLNDDDLIGRRSAGGLDRCEEALDVAGDRFCLVSAVDDAPGIDPIILAVG